MVGKIGKPFGIKGEVYVLPLTEFPDLRFAPGSLLLRAEGKPLVVAGSREHGARLLVRFEGAADRDAAEALRGTVLSVPQAELPDLPPDRWWPHELIGCSVQTQEGQSLGVLRDVLDTPASDIWVAVEGDRERLIPVLDDTIISVDIAARRVVVAAIPGLTTDER